MLDKPPVKFETVLLRKHEATPHVFRKLHVSHAIFETIVFSLRVHFENGHDGKQSVWPRLTGTWHNWRTYSTFHQMEFPSTVPYGVGPIRSMPLIWCLRTSECLLPSRGWLSRRRMCGYPWRHKMPTQTSISGLRSFSSVWWTRLRFYPIHLVLQFMHRMFLQHINRLADMITSESIAPPGICNLLLL